MRNIRHQHTLLVSGFLLASILAMPLDAQTLTTHGANNIGILPPPILGVRSKAPALPDASLYTTYSFSNNYTTLNWNVCGYTMDSYDCYGYGSMGPFNHIGAAVEGNPVANGNMVTRDIYVVDDAAGSGSGVTLYIYTKTDEVTSTGDMVSVNLAHTVSLPLKGGSNAKTYMAGDNGLLYIATNQTNGYLQMDESTLAYGLGGGFSPPAGGSSITTDKYGYVTATAYDAGSAFAGFYTLNPTGHLAEDGGGGNFMLDISNGISTGSGNFSSYPAETNQATHLRKQLQKTALSAGTADSTPVIPIDSGFFTTYTFLYSYTQMNWISCGYFPDGSDGCYGAGRLGTFGHVGAAIEGDEVATGNTVTRKIYIVGDAEGTGTGVTLYVYTKTDRFSLDEDEVTVNLTQTIPLPLTGGSQVKTFIAGDTRFLYIGTNQGASVVQFKKSNLAYQSLAGPTSSSKVSSVTTDAYGYVTITTSDNTGAKHFGVYDMAGNFVSSAGGGDFMLGASNGISSSDNNLSSTATKPNLAKRMNVRFNAPALNGAAMH